MNGHANGLAPGGTTTHHVDILVIGAGISGVNAGYRIQTSLPDHTYTILEGRNELGGTWSLFKYPGIRSDSDLHTFGFPFNPWEKPNPIATGASIVEYMKETTHKFGIDKKIQYNHKVVSADWSSDQQRWRVDVDNAGQRKVYHAKFLIMGTGYYNYDKPLQADIPGLDKFQGTRVHPQFWPEDLDYAGKKVVVIGSGATAITILPAMVDSGVGQITMLQRSPSYVMNMPQKKPGERDWWERFLPRWAALRIIRIQFIVIPWLFYLFCRTFPNAARNLLRKEAKAQLPPDFPMDPHFQPGYNPWDQRLCLCPDSDFFKCFETGRAQIVTDTIRSVVADGIELTSGQKLPADIIITATGLNIQICGNIALSVDKSPVHIPSKFVWRTAMLSDVPNLGIIVGYVNASWTLGADSASRLLCRLIAFMRDQKFSSATPSIGEKDAREPRPVLDLKSTYVREGEKKLPRAGGGGAWAPRSNYVRDSWLADRVGLREGLEFGRVSV
ncbi:FAD/NAD(P)-binding domain-containing protein [Polyplosphaeria fusca]|uniref:FAD/NAD(P)-binding domain-containing protein n=1 Tax=Polyplosphaeria fusca TaxID=682080 RepID=A0A9P4V4J4_9PLEO|nr:FAD/NAD(P)-binding domain-containing protein [Polyplosphaeria fusca]